MGFCAQRDWIITHSRHAKSFSRFLLDIPRPIFSTQSPEGPIHPTPQVFEQWKNQQILWLYPLVTPQIHRMSWVFSSSCSAVETKLLVLIVKTSCKNSIIPEQNPSLHEQCRARFKERNQNSETSNFAFALRIISTGKCCKWYRKPMQKYYFKETEPYLCSFPSHIFFGKGKKIVFAFNQNRSWNISRYACQKWKRDRWQNFHLTWQNIETETRRNENPPYPIKKGPNHDLW